MFAVIKTGGKQYRVAANDTLKIEKLEGQVGDIVEIGQVLAHGEGDKVTFGAPFVSGAAVAAEIVEQGKSRTVIAFKKRRRQNSRRKIGHRQLLTTVRISEILLGGAKPSKKAAAKPEAKAESKLEAKAEPKSEARAAAQSEAKAWPQPEAKGGPKLEAKVAPKSETRAVPQVKAKAAPKPEAKAEPKPEAKAQPDPKAEPKPDAAAMAPPDSTAKPAK